MPLFGLDMNGRFILDPSLSNPSVAAGAASGGSPPAPVLGAIAMDARGTATFGTGSAPAAGEQLVLTFSAPYTQADPPAYCCHAINAATVALGVWACVPVGSAGNWTAMSFQCQNAPAAGQGNGTYAISWMGMN